MTNKITQNTHDGKSNCVTCDDYLIAIDGTIFNDGYVGRLTKSLSVVTVLPQGDDWVCIIGSGSGTEKNNSEALTAWVIRQLEDLTDHQASQHVDILLRKFQNLVHDFY